MPTIEALEEITGQPKRRLVVFEDADPIELSLEVALLSGFLVGRTVDQKSIAEAVRADALKCAESDALCILSRKDVSVAQMERMLAAKNYDEEIIAAIIEKCIEWGYLNDERLAERLVSDSIELKHLGPARIRQKLRERGIDPELSDAVIGSLRNEQPSLTEQALAALKSKRRSYARLDSNVARRRMMGFLQRRGFDFDTIRTAIDQFRALLEEDDE